MIIGATFQAMGDAKRSAILQLSKAYIFTLPLAFILPIGLDDLGIWLAAPISEVLGLVLTIFVLYRRSRLSGERLGLLFNGKDLRV